MKKVIFLAMTLALLAAGCTNKPANTAVKDNSKALATTPSAQALIVSFTIEPSRKQDGWRLYKAGALAVLKASNIASAEVRYLPTGTGMGLEYPDGKSLGEMKKQTNGSYRLTLPAGLIATNFWVAVKNKAGKVIKGPDLGNVGEDLSK